MTLKKFDSKSFANFHPSGTLGKRLTVTVGDLVNSKNKPKINYNSKFSDAIKEISSKMLGATAVLKEDEVIGIITDGDIRRILEKTENPLDIIISSLITKKPKTVDSSLLAIHALQIMNINKITNLIVTRNSKYTGMIHIHDLIKIGL